MFGEVGKVEKVGKVGKGPALRKFKNLRGRVYIVKCFFGPPRKIEKPPFLRTGEVIGGETRLLISRN